VEGEDAARVVRPDRTYVGGSPVGQDHVGLEGRRIALWPGERWPLRDRVHARNLPARDPPGRPRRSDAVESGEVSVGTAFQRFEAFRSGFAEGTAACEALVPVG
jgi:hypothetical protein